MAAAFVAHTILAYRFAAHVKPSRLNLYPVHNRDPLLFGLSKRPSIRKGTDGELNEVLGSALEAQSGENF